MINLVIDASVAVKWHVHSDEEGTLEAIRVLESLNHPEVQGLVPAHFFAELGSVLYRRQPQLARKAMAELLRLELHVVLFNDKLLFECDRLITSYNGLIFYDALYHAVALLHGAMLVTADQKYYEQARKEGHIMLLKDF